MSNLAHINRALISVSNKDGILTLANALKDANVEILSTGGTASFLKKHGIPVHNVSDITGHPEILDGRVKTLHPNIHAGLLATRDNHAHLQTLQEHNIKTIDLLVTNLYPFEQIISCDENYSSDLCHENIDIGGPCMIRAGAKNHKYVCVVVDPDDYDPLISEMRLYNGATSSTFRQKLSYKAFSRTATYDACISEWMSKQITESPFPSIKYVPLKLEKVVRYGENPHQRAACYQHISSHAQESGYQLIQGKELSFNNMHDICAARKLISEFSDDSHACAIIKHKNPCGVALGSSPSIAYERARSCDEAASFGGVIAINTYVDKEVAQRITQQFTEVLICYDIDEDAISVLSKKPDVRVVLISKDKLPLTPEISQAYNSFLLQDYDNSMEDPSTWKTVTKRCISKQEEENLLFAWKVVKHVSSNAIVCARNMMTCGIGAGQMSRVDAVKIAGYKTDHFQTRTESAIEHETENLVMASDAFFPFSDSLLIAKQHGVSCIIQPGGSVRDQEIIDMADAQNLSMVFTGIRHFRH